MTDKSYPQSQLPIRRSVELLPKVFQTSANEKFMEAVVDPMIQPGILQKTVGYIGRRYGKTYNGQDIYLDTDNTLRSRYQLEPAVIGRTREDVTTFYDYLDFKNQLKFFGNTEERDPLITSQEHYAWNPPIEWDKFVNYREYYWVPAGPTPVSVFGQRASVTSEYKVSLGTESSFVLTPDGLTNNPTITLYRGQTYKFKINAPGDGFSIRKSPDLGSLLFNPFVTYFKGQLVSYEGKLWKAKAMLPPSDGSSIFQGSQDWEYVEDITEEISLEYVDGVTNNGIQNGTLTFEVPFNAPDILYYQSLSNPDRLGRIIVSDIESNANLNVETEILGKLNYTSANGVVFSNGLVVKFRGNVVSEKFQNDTWIVEGVGTGIRLVRFEDLVVPEVENPYTEILFDNEGFDTVPFDDAKEYPFLKDYITINRSSSDLNAWSRYNRWFHKSVLEYAAGLAGTAFDASEELRAKRPIIEFQPSLRLFNHGWITKKTVDYVDDFTNDVFSIIEGSAGYSVDGENLFDGARILVTADTDSLANNKIYEVKIITHNGSTQLTLQRTEDSEPILGETLLVRRGSTNKGATLHFDGVRWLASQPKTKVNQAPMFDAFTADGVSFSDTNLYKSTTFKGTPIFKYKEGQGVVDSELGFKLSYLNIDNVGDIEFEWTWDTEQFYYVQDNRLQTVNINSGFYINQDSSQYANGWIKADSQFIQPMLDSVKIESNTNEVVLDTIDWTQISSDQDFIANFYLNGTKLTEGYVRSTNTFTFGRLKFTYKFNESIIESNPGAGTVRLNDVDIAFSNHLLVHKSSLTGEDVTTWLNSINQLDRDTKGTIILTERATPSRTVTFEITSQHNQIGDYFKIPVRYVAGPRINIANNEELDITFIKNINTVFVTNDVVSIKLITDLPPNTGYYEIPVGLEKNPLNQNLVSFTLGQAVDHIYSAMEFNTEFQGNIPGISNLRDIQDYQQYAKRFLKHSGITPLSIYLFADKKNNIVKSIQYAKKAYTDFKNKFLQKAMEIEYNDNIVDFVDDILADLTKVKGTTSPFIDSDMVGNGAYTSLEYTVEDDGIKTFALTEKFNLTDLSRRAVYVYINGTQLLHGQDYEFNFEFGFVTILKDVAEGDRISIREYTSTSVNFIPPTPTKMGLYKKYTPMRFIDDTYREPVDVIQGHDGSITIAYGDFRDELLLELEYRIYNNIKQEYSREVFDVDQVIGGYYHQGIYDKQQLDEIVSLEFLKWVQNSNINYTINEYFKENETFTYTYSNMTDPTEKSSLPGWWRGVYQWFYDTDRPHRCPWEMLGFSEQPDWWEGEYGPAPYTSGNLLLWEDLRDGLIRHGDRAGTYDRYKRPSLLDHLPVDADGILLSPLESGLAKNFVLINNKGDFELGDVAPVEHAWRTTSEWPYAVVIAMCLLKPFEFISDNFDRSNTGVNILEQTVNQNTNWFPTLNDISSFSDENILTNGLIKYLIDYVRYQGTSLDQTEEQLKSLDVNLSTRVSGFVDKTRQKYLLDSKNPKSTSSGIFVPPENYDIVFNVSTPIDSVSYSGLIIEKTNGGWVVNGYDDQYPFFNYYEALSNQRDPLISVGGVSEPFLVWSADKNYVNGQIVQYRNYYYRCISTHNASGSFDKGVWRQIPTLPIVGAVEAYRRRNFNTLKVKRLNYGTRLTSIQQVVDFIQGYDVYLRSTGFEFEGYDPETQSSQDWLTSAKEFMYWTKHNWSVGSLITLSPGATVIKLNVPIGVVDNITDGFYDYQILTDNGKPISIDQLNVKRSFQTITVEALSTSGIYYLKLYYVLKEHVTVFSDRTVFNDVIYDKTTGYRQGRLKAQGFRTMDWDGDYTSPGFLFDNVNIQVWQPFNDYRLGDIVAYRSYYWTSQENQTGTETFDDTKWSKLDSRLEKQLVPNFDYQINQIEDYYSVDSEGIGATQRELARHLVGYQPREYLQNIAEDPITQFQLYQGFIKEKGTKNSVTKVFDKLSRTNESSIVLNEEWAFRVGRMGGVAQLEEYEILLDKNEFKINPQPILISASLPKNVLDQNYRVTKDNFTIYPKPYKTNINPVTTEIDRVKTAGYVRTDQIQRAVRTKEEILSLNIDEFFENDHTWVTFDNSSWQVLRFNQSKLVYPVAVSRVDDIVTITVNRKHYIGVGDIIGFRGIEHLTGFYKVINKTRITIEVISTSDRDPELPIGKIAAIFVFTPATYNRYEDVDFEQSAVLSSGAKLWIDNDGTNRWEVIEKTRQYSFNRISGYGIAEPLKAGYKVLYSDILKQMFVGTPSTRFVTSGLQSLFSTTSNTISIGTKEFETNMTAGVYGYTAGRRLRIDVVGDPDKFIEGTIISFRGTALVVSVDYIGGSGLFSNWRINIVSNGGQVLVYSESATGLKLRDLLLPGDALRSKESFGSKMAVSPDGQWLAVAAPAASYVTNDYLGEFDPNATYTFGSIVLVDEKLWRAEETVIGDGSPFDETSLSWKRVKNITADTGGMNQGGLYQGMICMYKFYRNRWDLRFTYVSPRPPVNDDQLQEYFGSDVVIGQSGTKYFMAVSAVGSNNNTGRVYLYEYDMTKDSIEFPAEWEHLENQTPNYYQNYLPQGMSVDQNTSTSVSTEELIKSGDRYGVSTAMTKDASILVVGAPYSDSQYFENYKGIWSSYAEYSNGDVVKYNDSYYRSLDDNNSQNPETETWQLIDNISTDKTGKVFVYQKNKENTYSLVQTLNAESLIPINDILGVKTTATETRVDTTYDTQYTIRVATTKGMKERMPIIFVGESFGGIQEGVTYYIRSIPQRGTSGLITLSTTAALDDEVIVFAARGQMGVVTDIEAGIRAGDRFGFSVDINDDGSTLVISSPKADVNYQDQGAVYILKTDSITDVSYRLKQKVTSAEVNPDELFGHSISISNDGNRLVVGAKNAPFSVSSVFDSSNTTFDQTRTTFADRRGFAGAVYVFEVKDNKYFLVEKLEADLGNDESFGFSVDCSESIIVVGSPTYRTGRFNGVTYTFDGPEVGTARLFKKTFEAKSWKVIAQQDSEIDLKKIRSIALYDNVDNVKIQDIDYIDLPKLKVLNIADQEIKFKVPYDPAIYTIGTEDQIVDPELSWAEKHKGELWWDLSTVKALYAEQGELSYRTGNWNGLAYGSSIDIYEWVETKLTPSEWAAVADTNEGVASGISGQPLYPNDDVVSVKILYNPTTGEAVDTLYYFWVRNKTIVPDRVPSRRISAASVASLIRNPIGSGIPFVAIIDRDKLLTYNFRNILTSGTALLNIQYRKSSEELNPIHNEYVLLTEGVADSLPPDSLETKWIDSLIGYNEIGDRVPDLSLSDKEKYGIGFRPRQSMFIDRVTVLKVAIESINANLLKEAFADTINFRYLNLVDNVPDPALNLYDIVVDNEVDLEATDIRKVRNAELSPVIVDGKIVAININVAGSGYKVPPPIVIDGNGTGATAKAEINDRGAIVAVRVTSQGKKYSVANVEVRGYSVLVLNDSTVFDIWSIYSWDAKRKSYYRTLSRRFDTTRYWSFVDWWKEGYGVRSRIVKEIATIKQEPTAGVQVGDLIKVKEYSNGGWAVFEKIKESNNFSDRYVMVGRQRGTIQFDRTLYDVSVNRIGYDNVESYDIGLYDLENFKELRNIFRAVKEDIYIGEYAVEWNKLFFTCIRYAFAEQQYIDWAFKTSFLNVKHNVGNFEQKLNYQNDNLSSYQKYIEEVKPYSTTLREYVSDYNYLDTANTRITDFDLPARLAESQGFISSGFTIDQLITGIPTNDNLGYSIVSINVVDGGTNYVQPPTVIITGNGVGATAVAYISSGSVRFIKVTNPGYGYTTRPTVSLVGGNGSSNGIATASAILGDAKTRTFNTTIKFDRISKEGIFKTAIQEETFSSIGDTQVFELMYQPSPSRDTTSVYKNNILLLGDEYTVVLYTHQGSPRGKLIINDQLLSGDSIRIQYERNDSLLDSVNRIEKHYAPTSGMKGKDLTQLMTGIDFGGVQLQGTTFDITGGWDALPWFTDGWDSVESTTDHYILVNQGISLTGLVTLPFIPTNGYELTIYLRKAGESVATRIDDPNYGADDSSMVTNLNAVMPTFVGDGFNETVDFSQYDVELNVNDVLIFRPVDSDGSIKLTDNNLIDTYLTGGDWQPMQNAYSTATGKTADEIVIDGSQFINPDHVPAPEENVPGQVLEGLSIKVYQSSNGTAAPLQSIVATADGIRTVFSVNMRVLETSSILVYVDKVLRTVGNGELNYSLDLRLGTVEFVTAPQTGSTVEIIAIGVGGVNLLDYKEFVADGSTSLFLTDADYRITSMVFVTVNGQYTDAVEFTDSSELEINTNRTVVAFNEPPESNSVIKIVSIASVDELRIPIVRVNREEFVVDDDQIGDDIEFELTNFINFVNSSPVSSVIVEVNNIALQGVDTETYICNGSTNQFTVGKDPIEASGSVLIDNLKIFVEGTLLEPIVDYSYNLISKVVTIRPELLQINDKVVIENNFRSQYAIVDNVLRIYQPFGDSTLIESGSNVTVTWFGEYPAMNVSSDEAAGGRSSYPLYNQPIDASFVWVYVNGRRLTPYREYYISVSALQVNLNVTTTPLDKVKIVSFSSDIYRNPSAYEIQKDMLNVYHFNRISSGQVTLAKDLRYYDQTIEVSDGTLLTDSYPQNNIGGVIYVNGERIEYLRKEGNTLSQIRRGHQGTAISELHAVGSIVTDISITERLPYADTQRRIDITSGITISSTDFIPMFRLDTLEKFGNGESSNLIVKLNGVVLSADEYVLTTHHTGIESGGYIALELRDSSVEFADLELTVISVLRGEVFYADDSTLMLLDEPEKYGNDNKSNLIVTINETIIDSELYDLVDNGQGGRFLMFDPSITVLPGSEIKVVSLIRGEIFTEIDYIPMYRLSTSTAFGMGVNNNLRVSVDTVSINGDEFTLTIHNNGIKYGGYLSFDNFGNATPFDVVTVVTLLCEVNQVLAKSNRDFYRITRVVDDGTGNSIIDYPSIPNDFGPCDQIEVFVAGRRLRKDPIVVYDESIGASSPAGDRLVEAEFSVNGVGTYVRLTEPAPIGVRITIIQRTGRIWYESTDSTKNLLDSNTRVARFIAEKTTELPE